MGRRGVDADAESVKVFFGEGGRREQEREEGLLSSQ